MTPLRTWASKVTGNRELADAPPAKKVAELDWLAPEHRAQLSSWGKAKLAPGNPPSWVGSEATWERAKKAVQSKWSDYDEPWAVVASVYQNMGGAVK